MSVVLAQVIPEIVLEVQGQALRTDTTAQGVYLVILVFRRTLPYSYQTRSRDWQPQVNYRQTTARQPGYGGNLFSPRQTDAQVQPL